jgi:hypothetical protein
MKSPWKFLAQFMPQRRSAERRASSIGHDSETERRQSKAQHASGLRSDATESPRGSEIDESQPIELLTTSTANQSQRETDAAARDDAEEFHAPARRQTVESTAQLHEPQVESGPNKKPPRAPPTKGLERAKRIRTDAIAQSNAVANRGKSSQLSSPRDAFFAEVASLDEDINQLRIQLAQKLHLQNDQLKKMLERFDVL